MSEDIGTSSVRRSEQDGKDPMPGEEGNKYLKSLAEFIAQNMTKLQDGTTALEFSPTTLKCLISRLDGKDKQIKRGFSFFKKDPTIDVMAAIKEAVAMVAHVMVTGQKLPPDIEFSALNFSVFPCLVKVTIKKIAISSVEGLGHVNELCCHDCSIVETTRLMETLKHVGAVKLFQCTSEWKTLQHVAKTLRQLHVQKGYLEEVLILPGKAEAWDKLIELDLSYNSIQSLHPTCGSLVNLTRINLAYNKLKDISALKLCPHIRYANLDENLFSSFAHIAVALPNVDELHIAMNKIETFHGLDNLLSLETLDVSNNNIGTFWFLDIVLEQCSKLNRVAMANNPVFKKVPVEYISVVERAAFIKRQKITLEGVQFGLQPEQTTNEVSTMYSRCWDPPLTFRPADPATMNPANETNQSDNLASTHRKQTTRTTVISETTIDASNPPPSKSEQNESFESQDTSELKQEKSKYQEDWLSVTQSTTVTNSGPSDQQSKTKTRKVVVKKIVKKKKVGDSELDATTRPTQSTEIEEDRRLEDTQANMIDSFHSDPAQGLDQTSSFPNNTITPPVSPPLVSQSTHVEDKIPSEHNEVSPPDFDLGREQEPPKVQSKLPSVLPIVEPVNPVKVDTGRLLIDQSTVSGMLTVDEVISRGCWAGVRNLLDLLPSLSFGPKANKMECFCFPLNEGPVWEEDVISQPAVEIWLMDTRWNSLTFDPSVKRYKKMYLIKVSEIHMSAHNRKYVVAKQRLIQPWEVDASEPKAKPSSFDRTPIVYACSTHTSTSNIFYQENNSVHLKNVDVRKGLETPKATEKTRSFSRTSDFEGAMDGTVAMAPNNADALCESIGFVAKQRLLCGLVVYSQEHADVVLRFLRTQMKLILDEKEHAPEESSFVLMSNSSIVRSISGQESVNGKEPSSPSNQGGTTGKAVPLLTLSAMRVGSHPPVTPDEVEMHMKGSVFGRPPDPKILLAYKANPGNTEAQDQGLRTTESLKFASYVNFLFSCDKENDERCGIFVLSDYRIYFALDYNMTTPALNLTQYFVPFTNHPRNSLNSIQVGYNMQYLRLTFGGESGDTYLLLTRDVSVTTGILQQLEAMLQEEGLADEVRPKPFQSPFSFRPLGDKREQVLSYTCMFITTASLATAPQGASRLLQKPLAWLSQARRGLGSSTANHGSDKLEYPQHIYPLRHVAKEMIPVSLVITPSQVYLVHENYSGWPDEERSEKRWTILRAQNVQNLEQIELGNERNHLSSHVITLKFMSDDTGEEKWVFVSQHGTNNASITHTLSKVWYDIMRIQLPRVDIAQSDKVSLFESSDLERKELVINGLVHPYKKAYGVHK
eukprot:PhF_6_TR36343/c0_g1_i1/m.53272